MPFLFEPKLILFSNGGVRYHNFVCMSIHSICFAFRSLTLITSSSTGLFLSHICHKQCIPFSCVRNPVERENVLHSFSFVLLYQNFAAVFVFSSSLFIFLYFIKKKKKLNTCNFSSQFSLRVVILSIWVLHFSTSEKKKKKLSQILSTFHHIFRRSFRDLVLSVWFYSCSTSKKKEKGKKRVRFFQLFTLKFCSYQ